MTNTEFDYGTLTDYLTNDASFLFLTGAGISAESGIDTFRGKDGLWEQFDPAEVATPEAFSRNPEKVWSFYQMRREQVREVEPGLSHETLAELEERFPPVNILTQNVDNLHERAGHQSLRHVHGNIMSDRCSGCGALYEVSRSQDLVTCDECGELLRPDVVWFGEALDPQILDTCRKWLNGCDVLGVIGTSLEVAPVSRFPDLARQNGSYLFEVNPRPVLFDSGSDWEKVFVGPADQFFKNWKNHIEGKQV